MVQHVILVFTQCYPNAPILRLERGTFVQNLSNIFRTQGKQIESCHSYPLLQYLDKLKTNGKTCFLITNSPYALVNAGMGHLVRFTKQHVHEMKYDVFFKVNR